MKNLILIGMPASGKSTAGVLAAKALRMAFLDTDLLIQQRENDYLQNLIDHRGIDAFLRLEETAILSVEVQNHVIATGGSVVYSDVAMRYLRSLGTVVFLHLSLDAMKQRLQDISTRGVVMKRGHTLDQLYTERLPLYRQYADVTIPCDGRTVEDTVRDLVAAVR
ncbi:MAG: shikimate kinase [Clostridiales bacterium]|nr:shikimate kinase [Clostridiales bacterium]